MSRRRRRLPLTVVAGRIAAVLIAVLAIYTALTALNFAVNQDYLPENTVAADIDIGGLTLDEAITSTAQTLANTVTVRYQGAVVVLEPAAIGARLDEAALRAPLEAELAERATLAAFRDRLLRRPRPPIRLQAIMRVDQARLRAFLLALKQKHDLPAAPPKLDPATLQRNAGAAGVALNLEDAQQQTISALSTGLTRTVELLPDSVPVDAPSLRMIEQIVRDKVAAFSNAPRVAGVYIKDLRTGDELSINGDVAFSAQGWLRWGIALESARTSDGAAVDNDVNDVNAALTRIGNGDAQAGAEQVTAMLREAGLVNTFVAQAYGLAIRPPSIVTPANARGDVTANPDPSAQSTPAEIGLLLEMLEQCRLNSGALVLLHPGLLTPQKCGALLNAFGQVRIAGMIDAASPGATVIQRQSWDARTHGAAALVRSPGGDYVIVIALHGAEPLDWRETSVIIGEVARVAFALFNSPPPPAAPISAPPPP